MLWELRPLFHSSTVSQGFFALLDRRLPTSAGLPSLRRTMMAMRIEHAHEPQKDFAPNEPN
jgi:hypothetical protein